MSMTDFISVLSLIIGVFSVGYTIGFYHGKNDSNSANKNNRPSSQN
jgi:hypothetical protein